MNNKTPKALNKLVEALMALPGVGQRSAERYAYYLLKNDPSISLRLSAALDGLHKGVSSCPVTYALIDSDREVSGFYDDPSRDKTTIAVVAEPLDIYAIERTSGYQGTYHVLGGLLSPIDGIGPENLRINQLKKRVVDDDVKEIILALSASVEAESTAMLLQQELAETGVTITRIAQGLPIGVDLEYADIITLEKALSGRRSLS